jgi:hypothetical protein
MTPSERLLNAVRFYAKHPKKWIAFASDRNTVETMCALNNLRIVQINNHQQARVNQHNARQFLADRDA